MNILITGGDGFLAQNITIYLKSKEHNVLNPNRKSLDLLNISHLNHFFKANNIDVVIHTAIKGGRRNNIDDYQIFYENLFMFENIISFKDSYKLFLNFGSGAEFDRKFPIEAANENNFLTKIPEDFYGLSKNIIAKRLYEMENVVNLRIFNCFAENECENRLIKTLFKHNENTLLDKWMDFFYIDDLCSVINWCINNTCPKNINCVYKQKTKLIDVANLIQEIKGCENKTTISEESLSYTGNGELLESLNIPLIGLKTGLIKYYKSFQK